jgi:hypothetical protein
LLGSDESTASTSNAVGTIMSDSKFFDSHGEIRKSKKLEDRVKMEL